MRLVIKYKKTEKSDWRSSTIRIIKRLPIICVDIRNSIVRLLDLKKKVKIPYYIKTSRVIEFFIYDISFDEVIATDEIFDFILNELETLPRLLPQDLFNKLYDTIRMAILEFLEKGSVEEKEVVFQNNPPYIHKVKIRGEEDD